MKFLNRIIFTLLLLAGFASAQSTGVTGQPVPVMTTQVGGSDGTNLRVLKVDSTGQIFTTSATGTGSNQVQGTAASGAAPVGNPVQIGGFSSGDSFMHPIAVTNSGEIKTGTGTLASQVQGTAASGAATIGSPVVVAGITSGGSNVGTINTTGAGHVFTAVGVVNAGADGQSNANIGTFMLTNAGGTLSGMVVANNIASSLNGTITWDRMRSVVGARQVSATNTANVLTIDTLNLSQVVVAHSACSAGTASLTFEVSVDNSNYLTLETVAAAATVIKQYLTSSTGATIALSPMGFRYQRITTASCGVGNTSTLTVSIKGS